MTELTATMTDIASDVKNSTMMELLSESVFMRFKEQFPVNIEDDVELRAASESCLLASMPYVALQCTVGDMLTRHNVAPDGQVCSVYISLFHSACNMTLLDMSYLCVEQ